MSELQHALMEELDAETDTGTEMVTETVTAMVTVADVETDAESDTETETVTEMVTIADVETDEETKTDADVETGVGTETDAEMSDEVSDADSDWEGGGGDVADLEDVAEATGQWSSDLSAADADFIGTLDLRAPTPRTLTAPARAGKGTLSVKVPIGKSRLRNFLRSSATLRPGALAERMKACAQEARWQAQMRAAKKARLAAAKAKLAAKAQKREAKEVAAEDAAAAREFNATMRLGAKVEVAQARGGSVSVATDPLKIHIKQFVKPIRLPCSAVEAAATVTAGGPGAVRKVLNAVANCTGARGYKIAQLFLQLPAAAEVPDYYDLVTQPISIAQMYDRLDSGPDYSFARLDADMDLMVANAHVYNNPGTQAYVDAGKLLAKYREAKAQVRAGGSVKRSRCTSVAEALPYRKEYNGKRAHAPGPSAAPAPQPAVAATATGFVYPAVKLLLKRPNTAVEPPLIDGSAPAFASAAAVAIVTAAAPAHVCGH